MRHPELHGGQQGEAAGQTTPKHRSKELYVHLTFVAAAIGGLVYAQYSTLEHELAEKERFAAQGAYEEFAPVVSKVRTLYEGQKQPKCAGEIEKIVPQKNKRGEFMGLKVICKPEATDPAK
jgi:hypothetical protein